LDRVYSGSSPEGFEVRVLTETGGTVGDGTTFFPDGCQSSGPIAIGGASLFVACEVYPSTPTIQQVKVGGDALAEGPSRAAARRASPGWASTPGWWWWAPSPPRYRRFSCTDCAARRARWSVSCVCPGS